MKCIYCDEEIEKIDLKNLFLKEDNLCYKCRDKLKLNKKIIKIENIIVETLYNYDGIFKDLLIQYKECFDEALSSVFLYMLEDYIYFKYYGYQLLFIPSSEKKLNDRGFNHLELMFKNVRLKKVEGLKMKKELIQEGKNYYERKQMINNYEYNGKKLNKVLIVDDVLTTGSSVLGVYNAIKPYANRVRVLVVSRKENAFILKNKCV